MHRLLHIAAVFFVLALLAACGTLESQVEEPDRAPSEETFSVEDNIAIESTPSQPPVTTPTPAPLSPCALSPLQVPLVTPWFPAPDMLCLERHDPESGQVARMRSYETDANLVAPGDMVTLRWGAEGGKVVLLEVYDWASIRQAQESDAPTVPPAILLQDLPLTGTHTVQMPDDLTGGARIVIWVADYGPPGSPVTMFKRLAFAIMDLPMREG
jgi:hypothetical protein